MTKTDSLGTRKRRKRGSLGQLRGVLWGSLLELEGLASSPDPDVKVKACNSLAALSRAYIACLAAGDIESRLTALEERLATMQPTNGREVLYR